MTPEQKLVDQWRSLPPAKQEQVLNFVARLKSENYDQRVEDVLPPRVEIWSPYGTPAVEQALLKLLEEDPGEEFD